MRKWRPGSRSICRKASDTYPNTLLFSKPEFLNVSLKNKTQCIYGSLLKILFFKNPCRCLVSTNIFIGHLLKICFRLRFFFFESEINFFHDETEMCFLPHLFSTILAPIAHERQSLWVSSHLIILSLPLNILTCFSQNLRQRSNIPVLCHHNLRPQCSYSTSYEPGAGISAFL